MNRVSEILCRLRAANYDPYNSSFDPNRKEYEIYKNMDDGRTEEITLFTHGDHVEFFCINPHIDGYEEKCFSCVEYMHFSWKALKTIIFYLENHDELLRSQDNWEKFSLIEDD